MLCWLFVCYPPLSSMGRSAKRKSWEGKKEAEDSSVSSAEDSEEAEGRLFWDDAERQVGEEQRGRGEPIKKKRASVVGRRSAGTGDRKVSATGGRKSSAASGRRNTGAEDRKMPAASAGHRWVVVAENVWVEDVPVSHIEVADDWSNGDEMPWVSRAIVRGTAVPAEWDIEKMPRSKARQRTPGSNRSRKRTSNVGASGGSDGTKSIGQDEMYAMPHRVKPDMMESIIKATGQTVWRHEPMGSPVEEGTYETDSFPHQQKWWHIRFEAGIKAGFALAHNAEVLEFLGIAKGTRPPLEDEDSPPAKTGVSTWDGIEARRVQTGESLAFGRSVKCLCGTTQSLNHIHQCRSAKMHYAFHRGIVMRYDEVQHATSDLFVKSLFPRPVVKEIYLPADLLGHLVYMKPGQAVPNAGPELDVWAMDAINLMENMFYQGQLTEFAVLEGMRLADRATGGAFMDGQFVPIGSKRYPRSLGDACEKRIPVLPQWLPWAPVYVEMLWWKLIQDREQERKKRREGGRHYRSDVLSLPVVLWKDQEVLAKASMKASGGLKGVSRWIPGLPILKWLFRWGYTRAEEWDPKWKRARGKGRSLPSMAEALNHPVFPFRKYGPEERLRRGIYRDIVREVYHEENIRRTLEGLPTGASREQVDFAAVYAADPLEGAGQVRYRSGSPAPKDLEACYGLHLETASSDSESHQG